MWCRQVFSASRLIRGVFLALGVYSAGLSATLAADSFKVGEATYTVVIQQPAVALERLAVSGTTPQKIEVYVAEGVSIKCPAPSACLLSTARKPAKRPGVRRHV